MKYELGEILFERDFESHDADGNVSPVKLQVSKPQLDAEKSHEANEPKWLCTHLITGIGDEPVFPAWGEDALEALIISLETANSVLEHYQRREQKDITWLGREDLRLPKMKSIDEKGEDYFKGFEEIFEEFFRGFQSNREKPQS